MSLFVMVSIIPYSLAAYTVEIRYQVRITRTCLSPRQLYERVCLRESTRLSLRVNMFISTRINAFISVCKQFVSACK